MHKTHAQNLQFYKKIMNHIFNAHLWRKMILNLNIHFFSSLWILMWLEHLVHLNEICYEQHVIFNQARYQLNEIYSIFWKKPTFYEISNLYIVWASSFPLFNSAGGKCFLLDMWTSFGINLKKQCISDAIYSKILNNCGSVYI